MTDNMRQAIANQEQKRRIQTENDRTSAKSTASLIASAITTIATIASLLL